MNTDRQRQPVFPPVRRPRRSRRGSRSRSLDGTRISYGDLIARAGRLANVLVALGVRPGDRVAVQIEKSVRAVLYLASLRAGAVYLPLNTAYTPPSSNISSATPSRRGRVRSRRSPGSLARSRRIGRHGRDARTPTSTAACDAAAKRRPNSTTRARRRRSGRDPLHLRHHRPLQGRDADARQPRVERLTLNDSGASAPTTC